MEGLTVFVQDDESEYLQLVELSLQDDWNHEDDEHWSRFIQESMK